MTALFQNIKKIFKYCLITFFAGVVLTIIIIYTADYIISKEAGNLTYDKISDVPFNKVGVVLGTSKYIRKGVPNLYFSYRIKAVCDLYFANKIQLVLISGDNRYSSYNEPDKFKDDLIASGIPENKIFLDFAGFRTYDSMIRANKVFGLSKFTVISQKFQNERAIYIAHKLNLDVVGFNAEDVAQYYGFKTNVREKFARVKVFIDFLFNKKPHFLGNPINIE